MHDVVIFTTKSGKQITAPMLKAVIAQARGQLQQQISGRRTEGAINGIIKNALYAGGELFIDVFLMKRFDMSYAKGVLGYRASTAYEQEKITAAQEGRPLSFRKARGIGFNGGVDTHGGVVMAPQPRPFVASGQSMRHR